MTKVDIIEDDVMWGPRVDDTFEFTTLKDASYFVGEYNKNKLPTNTATISWYATIREDI
jgi:hypothetical protein